MTGFNNARDEGHFESWVGGDRLPQRKKQLPVSYDCPGSNLTVWPFVLPHHPLKTPYEVMNVIWKMRKDSNKETANIKTAYQVTSTTQSSHQNKV